jgi:maleylpyruvate isomerase
MADALDLPEATRRLVRTADALTDEQYAEPSGLPGWNRAHVLVHLALNAEGLAGALTGIVEGTRVPMYASQEARDRDIADLAARAPGAIRSRLLGGCTDLADAIAAVPPDESDTTIDRVPGGRVFTAAAVPWMRLREVEIHHADLGLDYTAADWSADFVVLLMDFRAEIHDGPGFVAEATDLARTWQFAADGPTVSGVGSALAWWVTGRGTGDGLTSDDGRVPRIEAW